MSSPSSGISPTPIHRSSRTQRACDTCNRSRIRCGGGDPCQRCLFKGYICTYKRTIQRRGPKPGCRTATRRHAQKSADLFQPLVRCGNSARYPIPTGVDSPPDVGPRPDTPEHDTLEQADHEPYSCPKIDSSGENFWDDQLVSSQLPYDVVVPWQEVSQNSSEISRLAHDDTNLDFHDAGQTNISGHPLCKYPCLDVIIPFLQGVLSPGDACYLLDIFFANPEELLIRDVCPYVLSPVIRGQSVLRQSNPRPTSPALLVIILWCVSQTAILPVFEPIGARSCIVRYLYSLSLELLHARGCTLDSQTGYTDIQNSPDNFSSNITSAPRNKPPERNVDDILSYILLAIVEWRTHPLESQTRWWITAVNLVKELGYQSESRILEQTSLASSLSPGEAHEECRRAFWLVYTLDKYMALCFQEPVRLDSHECDVLAPLPERIWQAYNTIYPGNIMPTRTCTPPTRVSGTGFFEYFLPVMGIFAKIMGFRNRKRNLLPSAISEDALALLGIQAAIEDADHTLKALQSCTAARDAVATPPDTPHNHLQATIAVESRLDLSIEYAQYILGFCDVFVRKELLETTLHGKDRGWIAFPGFFSISQRA